MSIVVNVEAPRPSALLAWPVEYLDNKPRNIYQPHVTALYFPDVTEAEYTKKDMIDALRADLPTLLGNYELAMVLTKEAFGPDKNVPVLRVNTADPMGLSARINRIRGFLDSRGIYADRTWGINPHTTVDLETLIRPPEHVLLRPLELWWMNDEPVVV